jgi:hypothetical protein
MLKRIVFQLHFNAALHHLRIINPQRFTERANGMSGDTYIAL